MKQKVIIEPEDFPKVAVELTLAAIQYLSGPTTTAQDNAMGLIWRSLKHIQADMLGYLPEGERDNVDALCGLYMTLGIVIGGDKDLLATALQESVPRLKHIVGDEGGDEE